MTQPAQSERIVPAKTQEQLLAKTAKDAKKAPIVQSESEWLTSDGSDSNKGPSIVGAVSFDSDTGDILIRVPADSLTFANSRPTATRGRRMFCVQGDYDGREGLPGYMIANDAEGQAINVPVKFSSLNFNLFASKQRA